MVSVKRDIASYLIKNLLPLALIVIVLYTANFIPTDQLPVRVNIGITALLTSMVLYQRLSADLPSIGYMILMDYVFFIVFALAIGQVATSTLGFVANKQQRHKVIRLVERLGYTLIPVVLTVSLIILYVRFGMRA